MKNHLLIAASAAMLVLATSAFAQESAPGTSVQTGTAASSGSGSSMSAKPSKGKKAMRANSSTSAGAKTAITGPYGTSMSGGVPNNAQTTTSQGMSTSGANAGSTARSN